MSANDELPSMTVGERIRFARERSGRSRPVLGGLIGKSAEWVKAVENGRLLPPRLPMLARIAEILGVTNLAELTGEASLPVASVTKGGHELTADVARAMTRYDIGSPDESVTGEALRARVGAAWTAWHGSPNQRGAVGVFLPGLIADGRAAVRGSRAQARRTARVALAETYHLTQLFLAYQPVPELVWLAADRAMAEAREADDPDAIAVAAWYLAHVFRAAGQPDAACAVAADAARGVEARYHAGDAEAVARWGSLALAMALSYAKSGEEGNAWRYWDRASEAADRLPAGYAHPWLMFGRTAVDAYGVTIEANLFHTRAAIRRSEAMDLRGMPSRTRRSFAQIEAARAHSLDGQDVATIHFLRKAHELSQETVRFDVFSRGTLAELVKRGGPSLREDARDLADRVGLLV